MENNNQQTEIVIAVDEMDGLDVETSMQKNLNSLRYSKRKCCIYKIPQFIRKKKEECYRPSVISIGPAYYNDPELQPMQELKWIYMESFLNHPKNSCRNLDDYIKIVGEMKEDICDCYQKEIMVSCGDAEFIEMTVLDAIFLLAFFMKLPSEDTNKLSLSRPIPNELEILTVFMEQDLLVLENQIPFFVLKRIFDLAFRTEQTSLIDLTSRFISRSNLPCATYVGDTEMKDASNVAHLLDFYIKCFSFKIDEPQKTSLRAQLPMTVQQLVAAGVKFKPSKSQNPLEITFNKSNGELHIPHIVVEDKSEVLLPNILHFEQRHDYFNDHCYFSDLFFFIDSLIDKVEDVQILQQKGILKSYLGSDEKTANLFNNITTDLFTKTYINYYSDISKDVNTYASKRWNQWIAILRMDYFKHPWAVISFIFAIILFVLTVLQTVTGFAKN